MNRIASKSPRRKTGNGIFVGAVEERVPGGTPTPAPSPQGGGGRTVCLAKSVGSLTRVNAFAFNQARSVGLAS